MVTWIECDLTTSNSMLLLDGLEFRVSALAAPVYGSRALRARDEYVRHGFQTDTAVLGPDSNEKKIASVSLPKKKFIIWQDIHAK